jgi:RsiW-degrading membrane proteinase PrsW (M82 family)
MLALISVVLFLLASAFLVWYFLKTDHGAKKPKGTLFAAAGFGLVSVFAAGWLELFLPHAAAHTAVGFLALYTLGIGFIEETSKFVPLALFIHNKPYFREHADGIIYFAIVGLVFGFIENLLYVSVYNSMLGGGHGTGLIRLVVLLFFHAASCSIIGYYFAKAKIHRQSLLRPILALVTLALVHGLYDFLFLSASGIYKRAALTGSHAGIGLATLAIVGGLVVSALLNTAMFLYYRRARQWDISIGLATDPANPPQTQNGANTTNPPPNPYRAEGRDTVQ